MKLLTLFYPSFCFSPNHFCFGSFPYLVLEEFPDFYLFLLLLPVILWYMGMTSIFLIIFFNLAPVLSSWWEDIVALTYTHPNFIPILCSLFSGCFALCCNLYTEPVVYAAEFPPLEPCSKCVSDSLIFDHLMKMGMRYEALHVCMTSDQMCVLINDWYHNSSYSSVYSKGTSSILSAILDHRMSLDISNSMMNLKGYDNSPFLMEFNLKALKWVRNHYSSASPELSSIQMYITSSNYSWRVTCLNNQFVCDQAAEPHSSFMGCTGKLMQNYVLLSNEMDKNLSNPVAAASFERSKTLVPYENAKSLNDSTLKAISKYYLNYYSKCHSSAGLPLKPFSESTPTSVCGFCGPLK